MLIYAVNGRIACAILPLTAHAILHDIACHTISFGPIFSDIFRYSEITVPDIDRHRSTTGIIALAKEFTLKTE